MNTRSDPWKVNAEDFPAEGTSEEKLWFIVQYAVLAPSTHNTQPWRFRIHGNLVELYGDFSRKLPVVDPDGRELMMSCGAALFHLRTAIEYFGSGCEVELFPEPKDPAMLARVHLGLKSETTAEDILLFNAIPRRRTNRTAFLPDPVPDALVKALVEGAEEEGAWLGVIESEETRYAVAELVARADRRQWSSKEFRRELAAWLHPNRVDGRDGMPSYALGTNRLPAYAGPLVIRTFDLGKGVGAKDREIALYSPVLAVLGTDADTAADWMIAGQALAKVLLRARVEDVWASFLNQAIEVAELRPELAAAIGRAGCPQVLLRMGFGQEVKPTPRRSAKEVIINPHLRIP
jgi:hypothetical protein